MACEVIAAQVVQDVCTPLIVQTKLRVRVQCHALMSPPTPVICRCTNTEQMKMDVRRKYSSRGHTSSFTEFCGPLETTKLPAPSVAQQQQFNCSSGLTGTSVSTNVFSTVADKQAYTITEISWPSTEDLPDLKFSQR
jgi:hypothetical protein